VCFIRLEHRLMKPIHPHPGIGEEVRGYAMSIVDNTLSNEAKGTDSNGAITEKGKLEVKRGLADLGFKGSSTSDEDQVIPDSSSIYSANAVSGK